MRRIDLRGLASLFVSEEVHHALANILLHVNYKTLDDFFTFTFVIPVGTPVGEYRVVAVKSVLDKYEAYPQAARFLAETLAYEKTTVDHLLQHSIKDLDY